MSNEYINEKWFDFYTKLENASKSQHVKFNKYFLCPCCHFPTLSGRQEFEICFLCNWEDDGQDDHNANLVLGGPNQSYSLTEARKNFKNYLTSYRPSDKTNFERTTIKKTSDGNQNIGLTSIKRKIIEKYNSAMTTTDLAQQEQILGEIVTLEKQLL